MSSYFYFKNFKIFQEKSGLKVGTDAMVLAALVQTGCHKHILDIGAGTGVLACAMMERNPKAHCVAVEINEDACSDLQVNLNQKDFAPRSTMHLDDVLNFKSTEKFDLIVSNPPFYENTLHSSIEAKTLAKHVGELSLENLLLKVKELLTEDGTFYFIWSHQDKSVFYDYFENIGFHVIDQIEIYGKANQPLRWVFGLSQKSQTLVEKTLIIRDDKGSYTTDYIMLTKDLHGKRLTN